MQRRLFIRTSLAAGAAGFSLGARARLATCKILIGFPAGGSADMVARHYGELLRAGGYADAVIVESRTGAGGTIAAEALRAAPADGSVLLVSPSTVFTLQPHTQARLPYNPASDFTQVAGLAIYGGALAVGPKVPASVQTARQWADWARANPGHASYGSPGAGGGSHFVGFQVMRRLAVDALHVPYRGNQLAVADLIGGQVSAIVTGIPEIVPHVRSGKARVLAVTTPKRSPLLPGVPTLTEACCANVVGASDVMGLHAPARLDAAVFRQLDDAARRSAAHPDFLRIYAQMSYEPHYMGGPDFAVHLHRERTAWRDVVKASGFRPDA